MMHATKPHTESDGAAHGRPPSFVSALLRDWRLLAVFVALGVLVGVAVTIISAERYTATSLVYVGQTIDAGGTPVSGVDTDTRAISQLLASDEVLAAAAARADVGLTAADLARKTSVSTAGVIVIGVTDTDAARAAAASNAVAAVLIEHISAAVAEKTAALQQQLASSKAALTASEQRSAAAAAALHAVARDGGRGGDAASYVAVLQAASSEQQALRAAVQKNELVLLTLRQQEQARLLHVAEPPDEPSGPVLSVNVAVGALVGFLVAVVVLPLRRLVAEEGRP